MSVGDTQTTLTSLKDTQMAAIALEPQTMLMHPEHWVEPTVLVHTHE